jgi:hypothetical protein
LKVAVPGEADLEQFLMDRCELAKSDASPHRSYEGEFRPRRRSAMEDFVGALGFGMSSLLLL